MKSKHLKTQAINTGSMADIAFLLLIFFLVSTTILQEKGLMLRLPPKVEDNTPVPIKNRNIFKILINSKNQFLIEGEIKSDLNGLGERIKPFVLNNGLDPALSESPEKAVISIKTGRGTSYEHFISVLDLVKTTYYELYGEKVGLTGAAYRLLDRNDPAQNARYLKGKRGIPMNISIAQPDAIQ